MKAQGDSPGPGTQTAAASAVVPRRPGLKQTRPDKRVKLMATRHGLLIAADMLPDGDGANINGPSLVRMPDWVKDRLGTYYLYFAHHTGTYIRLAYSDALEGPWHIHRGGVLSVAECPFLRGHVASPDVHVDEQNQRIVMYFHGPVLNGREQVTFAATSADGLNFTPRSEALGHSYARIFHHDGRWYGLFGAGRVTLCRSVDGISGFDKGPVVLSGSRRARPRHVAVQRNGHSLVVYYTRKGDAPERIFYGSIDLSGDWQQWEVRGRTELLRPGTDFEGAGLPVRRSRIGSAKGRENALRDPAIFEEDGRTWLLYAAAGESGIALAELGEVQTTWIERTIAGPAVAHLARALVRVASWLGVRRIRPCSR